MEQDDIKRFVRTRLDSSKGKLTREKDQLQTWRGHHNEKVRLLMLHLVNREEYEWALNDSQRRIKEYDLKIAILNEVIKRK